MSKANTDKKQLMKKSIRRACGKQRFAGFLYFLGTLAMAVACFFTLMTGFVFTTGNDLNVGTFLVPLLEVGNAGVSFLPIGANFFCALLYLFTLVFCVINALRALAKLDYLYMPGSRRIGFNQNAIAMDKLGKIFSSTFVSLAYLMYYTHMFVGAKPTILFYIVTAVFLIIHFWAGIVGAKGSRFTARDGVQEFPRIRGRLAPFIRNVMQFALIAGLLYFMSKANIINNLFVFFNGERAAEIFGALEPNFGTFISCFVNPLLQLFICHFMLALVIHATDTTEWHREGSKAKGMKTCRIFSMLIFLFALAFNVTHLYLNLAHGETEVSTQMIFVAVIALALFIEECCMAKLPSIKKKYQQADKVDALDEESKGVELEGLQKLEVLPPNYKYVDAPAVYMQPNGAPILVMPAMEVAEDEEEVPSLKVATPMGENALAKENYKLALKARWMARAKGSPEEEEEVTPLQKPSDEKDNLTLGEEKKVKCPFCKTIVLAQEGAPAYECPECGEKFSFKKESK